MGRRKCQPKKGGLVQKLRKEWIPYFQQHGMTSRLRNAFRTKKWTTTQIALVVRTYPDASSEPTPELSEESSPEDSGVEPSEASSRRGDSPPAAAQPKPVAQPKPGTSRGGGSQLQ